MAVGQRTTMIGELKDYLECDLPSYEWLDNFNSRVVDAALSQINELTDITCEYELNKLGRHVADFKIKVKPIKSRVIKSVTATKGKATDLPLPFHYPKNPCSSNWLPRLANLRLIFWLKLDRVAKTCFWLWIT